MGSNAFNQPPPRRKSFTKEELLEESDSGGGSSEEEDGFDFAPVRRNKNESIMSNVNFMKDAAKDAEKEEIKKQTEDDADFFT